MKKRRNILPSDVQRWIAKGCGQGIGRKYSPFLKVRDVPSRGRSSMVPGLTVSRDHHYLSDLEYYCHLLAEFDPDVTDIREQYALLPWEETQEIAEALGIRHPIYPGTKTPVVMTSDLVRTHGKAKEGPLSYSVLSVKPFSEIDPENPRTKNVRNKLLIEEMYWKIRGIPWDLVTEREIPVTRAKNLDRLWLSVTAKELDRLNPHWNKFLIAFEANWRPNRTLFEILEQTAIKIGLTPENCYTLFARATWLRLLPVDLDSEKIHHDLPLLRKSV